MTEKQINDVRDKLRCEKNKFRETEIERLNAYCKGYSDGLYDFRVEVEKIITDESKEDMGDEPR